MKWRRKGLVLVAMAAVLGGYLYWVNGDGIPSQVRRAMEEAEQFEVYSLLPKPEAEGARPEFHQYQVLGNVSIADGAMRKRVRDALKEGSKSGEPKACFEPRHAIRMRKGDAVTDLVICFECEYVQIWTNNQRNGGFPVGPSPQATFDEILKKAGVQLAPTALTP